MNRVSWMSPKTPSPFASRFARKASGAPFVSPAERLVAVRGEDDEVPVVADVGIVRRAVRLDGALHAEGPAEQGVAHVDCSCARRCRRPRRGSSRCSRTRRSVRPRWRPARRSARSPARCRARRRGRSPASPRRRTARAGSGAATDANTSATPLLSPATRSAAVEVKITRWPSEVRNGSVDDPAGSATPGTSRPPAGGAIAADAASRAAGAIEVNPAASSAAAPATATKRSRSGAGGGRGHRACSASVVMDDRAKIVSTFATPRPARARSASARTLGSGRRWNSWASDRACSRGVGLGLLDGIEAVGQRGGVVARERRQPAALPHEARTALDRVQLAQEVRGLVPVAGVDRRLQQPHACVGRGIRLTESGESVARRRGRPCALPPGRRPAARCARRIR